MGAKQTTAKPSGLKRRSRNAIDDTRRKYSCPASTTPSRKTQSFVNVSAPSLSRLRLIRAFRKPPRLRLFTCHTSHKALLPRRAGQYRPVGTPLRHCSILRVQPSARTALPSGRPRCLDSRLTTVPYVSGENRSDTDPCPPRMTFARPGKIPSRQASERLSCPCAQQNTPKGTFLTFPSGASPAAKSAGSRLFSWTRGTVGSYSVVTSKHLLLPSRFPQTSSACLSGCNQSSGSYRSTRPGLTDRPRLTRQPAQTAITLKLPDLRRPRAGRWLHPSCTAIELTRRLRYSDPRSTAIRPKNAWNFPATDSRLRLPVANRLSA